MVQIQLLAQYLTDATIDFGFKWFSIVASDIENAWGVSEGLLGNEPFGLFCLAD